jgi:hypothetical protein
MGTIQYVGGIKHVDTWKVCDHCFHEFFIRYNQCPGCGHDSWKLGKRLLAVCKMDVEGEEANRFFIFESKFCDVSFYLIRFFSSCSTQLHSQLLLLTHWTYFG